MNALPDEPRTGRKTIEVALLALVRPGSEGWEVVLTKRPAGAHLGGYWELPGGKVEQPSGRGALMPETPRQAAVREAREELGITVDPKRLEGAGERTHAYADRTIRFHLFVLRHDAGGAVADSQIACEHAWVRLNQLDGWNLPPANVAINRLLADHLDRAL